MIIVLFIVGISIALIYLLNTRGAGQQNVDNMSDIVGSILDSTNTTSTNITSDSHSAKNIIRISGSTSGISILNFLANDYKKTHPEVTFEFPFGTSTGDGITGVAKGLLDIGSAARNMEESEKEKYPNITEHIYVKDAMILGVNPNVSVSDISSEQAIKIHSGEITNWSALGGQDGTIVVLSREESESSMILLRRHILGQDLKITDKAIILHSSESMNKALTEIPNTIGQSSLGIVKLNHLNIKALSIDGITPTEKNITGGTYKLVRNYLIILPKDIIKPEVNNFVNFVLGKEAAQLLRTNSFFPPKIDQ